MSRARYFELIVSEYRLMSTASIDSRGSPAQPQANDPAAEHNEGVNDVVVSKDPDVFKAKVDPEVIQEEKPNENAAAEFEPAVSTKYSFICL